VCAYDGQEALRRAAKACAAFVGSRPRSIITGCIASGVGVGCVTPHFQHEVDQCLVNQRSFEKVRVGNNRLSGCATVSPLYSNNIQAMAGILSVTNDLASNPGKAVSDATLADVVDAMDRLSGGSSGIKSGDLTVRTLQDVRGVLAILPYGCRHAIVQWVILHQ
jgi:hypothetical protein